MSGPWERYAAQPAAPAEDGPWSRYAQAPADGPDQSDAEGARLARAPKPEGPGIPEQLGRGAMHGLQRASAGLAGAGKFMLGPLAAPLEALNEYATGKGYPLAPTDRQLAAGQKFVDETGLASTIGQIGGDIAVSMVPAAGITSGVARATASMLPRASAAARAAAAALGEVGAQGALSAAMAPEDRAQAALWGAGGQAGGMFVRRALGGAVKPMVTPEARTLMQAGVQPTVGQSLARGNWLRKLEDTSTSVPIISDAIQGARRRSLGEFSDAAIRSVGADAPEALVNLPKGRNPAETVEAVREGISGMYDNALQGKVIGADAVPGLRELARSAANDSELFLTPDKQESVLRYVEGRLLSRFDAEKGLSGEAAKQAYSDMMKRAREFKSSNTADDRNVGAAIENTARKFYSYLKLVELDPKSADTLTRADAAYGPLMRVEKAGRYVTPAGQEFGTVTPAKLNLAMNDLPKGRNLPRALQRMRELERAGSSQLSGTVPDSGTATRLMTPGGIAALGTSVMNPAGAVAGAIAAGGMYTRAGSALLTQGVKPEQVRRFMAAAQARGIPPDVLEAQLPNIFAAWARTQESQR